MTMRNAAPAVSRKVLVGLIGANIQMSKSPPLHQREGALQGLDYRYELLDLTERSLPTSALPDLLNEAERRGFSGCNVTYPCKQAVIDYLTDLSEDARMLGAVNTVVFKNGARTGHNTDWYGFYENFRRGLPDVARRYVVQLGAGGAGVAVAHAAIKLGTERLGIYDQDSTRATRLAAELNDRFAADRAVALRDVAKAMSEADGLINATPMGMKSHPGLPIEEGWLSPRHWVADIVYMPLVTDLLALASRRGCLALPGGGMTVFQAAAAFKLFTGVEPDADRMGAHFAELAVSR
jgi:shikimate dehydrogenase